MQGDQSFTPYAYNQNSDWLRYALNKGQLFAFDNPTAGTEILHEVIAAFSATKCLMNIRNGESLAAGAPSPYIYPVCIKLIQTQAPASAVRSDIQITLDTGAARRASGGTLITPVSPMAPALATWTAASTVYFGAVQLNAATAQQRFGHEVLKYAIPTAGDVYELYFGELGRMAYSMNSAGPDRRAFFLPPCGIAPGSDFNLHAWYVSNATTEARYEVSGLLLRA